MPPCSSLTTWSRSPGLPRPQENEAGFPLRWMVLTHENGEPSGLKRQRARSARRPPAAQAAAQSTTHLPFGSKRHWNMLERSLSRLGRRTLGHVCTHPLPAATLASSCPEKPSRGSMFPRGRGSHCDRRGVGQVEPGAACARHMVALVGALRWGSWVLSVPCAVSQDCPKLLEAGEFR